jgi:hypothetical protein
LYSNFSAWLQRILARKKFRASEIIALGSPILREQLILRKLPRKFFFTVQRSRCSLVPRSSTIDDKHHQTPESRITFMRSTVRIWWRAFHRDFVTDVVTISHGCLRVRARR